MSVTNLSWAMARSTLRRGGTNLTWGVECFVMNDYGFGWFWVLYCIIRETMGFYMDGLISLRHNQSLAEARFDQPSNSRPWFCGCAMCRVCVVTAACVCVCVCVCRATYVVRSRALLMLGRTAFHSKRVVYDIYAGRLDT
ncbi:hypothetical protein LZ31DRAFT_121399 [Colletotrichum somersetense]|nr:hypothetical protein LZ31DRAFT_121399 [Colletotrichum somersetense]